MDRDRMKAEIAMLERERGRLEADVAMAKREVAAGNERMRGFLEAWFDRLIGMGLRLQSLKQEYSEVRE